jgi:hypothetical protein
MSGRLSGAALAAIVTLTGVVSVSLSGAAANAAVSSSPSAAGAFVSVTPTRLMDTRYKLGGSALGSNGTLALPILGKGPVPTSGVSAVVLNVTATSPTASGYVTVWADGKTRPKASNLNFVKGETVPNLVVAPVGTNGKIDFYNYSGTTQLIADVAGYYLSPPAVTPVSNVFATPSTTTVALSWTNPTSSAFTGVTIRRATGAAPPASATAGTAVASTTGSTTTFADTVLTPGTQYSYALFAHDGASTYAAAATTTATTLVTSNGPGPILQPSATNVTADPLPTVQIDGVAWAQTILGNTVFVGGSFANARPYGSALGTNEVARSNLLAYNLTTGALITSFAPSLNGQVLAVAASPNGSVLYVGGDFTTVNGTVSKSRIAAFSTSTGALITSFHASINAQVTSIAATSTTVYVGGKFTAVNGAARDHVGAVTAATGAVTTWKANTNNYVNALVLTPDGTKLVIGGRFTTINSTTAQGVGAVDAVTGASFSWAVNQVVKDSGDGSAIESLATDGNAIYGTGYNFGGGGNFEGTFSADPTTGKINWLEDCHGDTYSVFAVNGIAYTVGHAHFCANDGGWPVFDPWQYRRTVAFTSVATGTLKHNSQIGSSYKDFYGALSPSIINWFPDLLTGTYTGQGQAAWTVTGNSQYIVEGGEFPGVNNKPQQGLVRFAIRSIAPGTQGPRLSGTDFVPTLTAQSDGSVKVTFGSNWDRDDLTLTYQIVRDGDNANPVWTATRDSEWWNLPTLTFTDTGVTSGTTYEYQLYASDGHGNTVHGDPVTITAP